MIIHYTIFYTNLKRSYSIEVSGSNPSHVTRVLRAGGLIKWLDLLFRIFTVYAKLLLNKYQYINVY